MQNSVSYWLHKNKLSLVWFGLELKIQLKTLLPCMIICLYWFMYSLFFSLTRVSGQLTRTSTNLMDPEVNDHVYIGSSTLVVHHFVKRNISFTFIYMKIPCLEPIVHHGYIWNSFMAWFVMREATELRFIYKRTGTNAP